jgi:citrate lyase subunit beta/citryl-CoA lyase
VSQPASAGRPGAGSDCRVLIAPADSGGIKLEAKSRVDYLYADAIRELALGALERLGIVHARVVIDDQGAVPFVMLARIEAAVRRSWPGRDFPECLPEPDPAGHGPTSRDRWRRSRLYVPGNDPKYILNAHVHAADAIILDLEDAVPPDDRDAALILVRNALHALSFGDCERMARVNQLPQGLADIPPLVRARVQLLLLPKCENPDDIRAAADAVAKARAEADIGHDIFLMPIIESPLGMFRALDIALASPLVAALTWGLEDYLREIGGRRSPTGEETLWARSRLVNAARAAGVQPIDTVYSDIDDIDGLRENIRRARDLGFEGKGCIHPCQVPVVNNGFTPAPDEIDEARRIVEAFEEARRHRRSVVAVGRKMIDAPVVARAQRVIELARRAGLLSPADGGGR